MKNCLNPQKTKNVRPHSSNSIENAPPSSSHENATPLSRLSGTSPLDSYKELPLPPPPPPQPPGGCGDVKPLSQLSLVDQWTFTAILLPATLNYSRLH